MDIKKMLVDLAEAQADKVKDEMLSQLSSSDMEEKEQIFFEKVVDVVTDLLHGVLKGK